MITSAERELALKQLDQSRDRLLRICEGLSPHQLLYRPAPDCWSIAEIVEHVAVVERRVMRALKKLTQEPPDTSRQSAMCDAEVIWQGGTVVEPLQAPESALPTSRWPVHTLLQEFLAVRQHTRDFASTTTGDLRHHFLPHPKFGDMDCYQWLLLAGAHCNRHCTQSDRINASRALSEAVEPANVRR